MGELRSPYYRTRTLNDGASQARMGELRSPYYRGADTERRGRAKHQWVSCAHPPTERWPANLRRIFFQHRVNAARYRQRVVIFALPDVAPEDQPRNARVHRDAGLVQQIFISDFAAAGNEHHGTAGRLDDLSN